LALVDPRVQPAAHWLVAVLEKTAMGKDISRSLLRTWSAALWPKLSGTDAQQLEEGEEAMDTSATDAQTIGFLAVISHELALHTDDLAYCKEKAK